MAEKEEMKYLVIKIADLNEYLEQYLSSGIFNELQGRGKEINDALQELQNGIREMRKSQGRPIDNEYIVCNQDEPYSEKVWQIILEGEDAKPISAKKLEEAGKFLTKDKELPWPAGRGTH